MTIKTFSQRFTPEDLELNQQVPERNLLAAMLERACRDLVSPNIEKHIIRAADQWFRSNKKGRHSFRWVCAGLDLDPDYVRNWIFKMKEEKRPYPTYENRLAPSGWARKGTKQAALFIISD